MPEAFAFGLTPASPNHILTFMKKIILSVLVLATGLSLQSCFGGDNENHGTSIYNSQGNMASTELYADQTLDSLFVVSYDSWTARTEGNWFEISDKVCKVPAGYIITQTVLVKTTPNTTGKLRSGAIFVNSDYPEYGELRTNLYQTAWLNISVPVPQYEQVEDKATGEKYVAAKFEAPINAADNYALLGCTVYADATLTSDANWLSVNNEDQTLKPGNHGIKFVVSPNNDPTERVAHVTLTSNGVSNVITYTQKGKK